MTATYRLKGLGWLAIAVIAALGFYLVSLQVSVERKKLDHVNRQIAEATNDIRSLQTEFSTRANLAQLERWNGDVLALSAPTAAQYMSSGQQLASLGSEAPDGAEVQMASLVIPTLPVVSSPDSDGDADDAASQSPARAMTAAAEPAHAKSTPAKVEVASAKPAADPLAAIVKAAAARSAKSSAASHAKEQAMAMLDRKLLSDATLGDLMSKARAETASLR
ncbi:hypothetical protein [Hephaestia mangrovi]|uniref:hypothetical protein n=1 Tax=Hephaestia mangrovi TaxID=2873268 RepID=UPI001CA6190B|nr:hypothetical protein [Hephaestia mangrovi]MBY8826773.1 hypothetical protein [Hephaestia mangrovi]